MFRFDLLTSFYISCRWCFFLLILFFFLLHWLYTFKNLYFGLWILSSPWYDLLLSASKKMFQFSKGVFQFQDFCLFAFVISISSLHFSDPNCFSVLSKRSLSFLEMLFWILRELTYHHLIMVSYWFLALSVWGTHYFLFAMWMYICVFALNDYLFFPVFSVWLALVFTGYVWLEFFCNSPADFFPPLGYCSFLALDNALIPGVP